MGAQQSQVKEFSQEGLKEFHRNFDLVKKEDDPRYGTLTIFQEKSSGKYISQINKQVFEAFKSDTFKRKLQYRIMLDHQNLLKNIGYTLSEDKGYCGGGDVFTIYSEWFEHDLDLEIIQRIPKSDFFTESELWYMIKSVVSVCAYLEQNDVYHGDLRPMNIIMNEEGLVYVADHSLLHPLIDSWGKFLAGDSGVYLSPEALGEIGDYIETKANKMSFDVYKNDTFSLGMSMLFAANLIDPKICYNLQKYTVTQDKVHELISLAGNRYSQKFTSFLSVLLLKGESERPSFQGLQQFLLGNDQGFGSVFPQNQTQNFQKSSNFGNLNPSNNLQSPISERRQNSASNYNFVSNQVNASPIRQNDQFNQNQNMINSSSPFRRTNIAGTQQFGHQQMGFQQTNLANTGYTFSNANQNGIANFQSPFRSQGMIKNNVQTNQQMPFAQANSRYIPGSVTGFTNSQIAASRKF